MVGILPPDISLTFLSALIVPLIIGFLVGIIVKNALKIGVAIAALIIILIAIGAIAPDQVIQPIVALFRSGASLGTKVNQLAGYLPYSSLAFIIGLAVGFYKG